MTKEIPFNNTPSTRESTTPAISAADVFVVLKRFKDNDCFDWDHVAMMCREIAATTSKLPE